MIVIFFLLLMYIKDVQADVTDLWDGACSGWAWGDDETEEEDLTPEEELLAAGDPTQSDDDWQKEMQQHFIKAKAKLMRYPTLENFASLLRVQNAYIKRGKDIANLHTLVLMKYPGLDPNTLKPSNDVGLQIAKSKMRADQTQKLFDMASKWILVFIGDFSKPDAAGYSQAVIQSLRGLAAKFNFTVMAIGERSIDGFINIDGGNLKSKIFNKPAIVAVNPATGTEVKIIDGWRNRSIIVRRLLLIERAV